jgi:hypothetical protein
MSFSVEQFSSAHRRKAAKTELASLGRRIEDCGLWNNRRSNWFRHRRGQKHSIRRASHRARSLRGGG